MLIHINIGQKKQMLERRQKLKKSVPSALESAFMNSTNMKGKISTLFSPNPFLNTQRQRTTGKVPSESRVIVLKGIE
jgi:hypothetical protein